MGILRSHIQLKYVPIVLYAVHVALVAASAPPASEPLSKWQRPGLVHLGPKAETGVRSAEGTPAGHLSTMVGPRNPAPRVSKLNPLPPTPPFSVGGASIQRNNNELSPQQLPSLLSPRPPVVVIPLATGTSSSPPNTVVRYPVNFDPTDLPQEVLGPQTPVAPAPHPPAIEDRHDDLPPGTSPGTNKTSLTTNSTTYSSSGASVEPPEVPLSTAEHNMTVAALIAAITAGIGGVAVASAGLGMALWLRRRRRNRVSAILQDVGSDCDPENGANHMPEDAIATVAVGRNAGIKQLKTPSSPRILSLKSRSEDVSHADELSSSIASQYRLGGGVKQQSIDGAVLSSSAVAGTSESVLLPELEGGIINPQEIQILRRSDGSPWRLGTGSYGTVYRGLRDGVQPVAVKIVPGMDNRSSFEDFWYEVSLLRACRDANVVQFIGACVTGEEAYLVTELMELGDLWRAVRLKAPATGERVFGWSQRGGKVMLDVAKGLHYLHTHRILHLDIKSANVLLTRDGTGKLADVGMARVLSRSHLSAWGAGTFAWSAPEVLAGRRCSEKADIYSWGVVLWEVCTGEAPVRGNMRPLQCPDDCPAEVVELHSRCLAEDPDERPSAREIVHVLLGLLPVRLGGTVR